MITKERFIGIENEVISKIENALYQLFVNYPEDYVLFMACGEYDEIIANNKELGLSPYTISGYNLDNYYDITRQQFLCDFLNMYYNFADSNELLNDDYRINIEFLIYAHIWETKPFLKKLYRIANLLCGKEYDWKIQIPNYKKSDFITKKIIAPFNNSNCDLGRLITNTYNADLRNAIAHSDYQLHEYITFKSKTTLYNITFDEWSIHFVYSFCFSYHFAKITNERRKRIFLDWGKNDFTIKMPFSDGTIKHACIQYDKERDVFAF